MGPLRFLYQTIELGSVDIHIRSLRDKLEFSDDEGEAEALGISSASWPLFGVLWDSSWALARLMLDYDVEGKRILEVGCGLGLASLVLHQRKSDITATDHHPEVENFLIANAELNGLPVIPFERTGWDDGDDTLGTFDLIIASEVLYERAHVLLLSSFIERHSRPGCEVIVFDPGRGERARFRREMVSLGYECTFGKADVGDRPGEPYKGQVMKFMR